LLKECQLSLTWRLTPAGSASTPVPHPVLLVETAERAGNDVLAHQLTELLSQAGVFASVEVLNQHTPVGEYHRAAKEASTALEISPPPAQMPSSTSGKVASASPARPDQRLTDLPPASPRFATTAQTSSPQRQLGSVERVITARSVTPAAPSGHDAASSFDEAAGRATQRYGHHPATDARHEPDIREPRGSRESSQGSPASSRPPREQNPPRRHTPPPEPGTHLGPPQDPARDQIWAFGPPN
jgi:hypothetical protein